MFFPLFSFQFKFGFLGYLLLQILKSKHPDLQKHTPSQFPINMHSQNLLIDLIYMHICQKCNHNSFFEELPIDINIFS